MVCDCAHQRAKDGTENVTHASPASPREGCKPITDHCTRKRSRRGVHEKHDILGRTGAC